MFVDYPGEVSKKIIKREEGLIDYKGQIIFTAPLLKMQSILVNDYVIFKIAPNGLIFRPVYRFSTFFISMLLLFLILSTILAIIAARQITVPIRNLQKGAEIISSGNYDFRLNIETNDEIEDLARRFNSMAETLTQHEREIIMHRTRLEELVRERTEKLIRSAKLASVGEMATVIAHEIKNSITSIKMILQLHRESNGLTDEDKESLGVAMNSIERIENVINQMLQFARPAPLKFELTDINSLLDLSVEFCLGQFKKKNIKVIKFYDRNLPKIYADANSLKEAFINILINASQSVDRGWGNKG